MARPRLPLALLWPTGLVVLVGVLAFFQYRWLGQVSEAERNRLRTTLNQRAKEFADDFDREIGRVYTSLRINSDAVANSDWEPFAKRFDSWKETSAFPSLIRRVFITSDLISESAVLEFSPERRQFARTEWPANLQPVRDRLRPFTAPVAGSTALPGAVRFVSLGSSSIVTDVPAILIPIDTIQRVLALPKRPNLMSFRLAPSYVIAELDRDYILKTVVPTLVERHFAVDDYHVQIRDLHEPTSLLFARGTANGAVINDRDADAVTTFFGVHGDALKRDIEMSAVSGIASALRTFPAPASAGSFTTTSSSSRFSIMVDQRGTTAASVQGSPLTALQLSGNAWQLLLQHPAGSLEVAVGRARVRNLSLSFGVLAVLAAGVFLITINAQRAQRLAAQQMDFVATVSHELRTPLAVIRSAAQNLSAGVVHEPAQAKRYGDLIDSEGRRLTDMVEQVLSYAGLSGPKRPIATQPCDVAALTQDVVASCDSLIREAGFTVEVNAAEDVPNVALDESAFRRALSNLIVNALKYGAEGSWLGVDVRTSSGRGGKREVQVSVADRGHGIDAQDLPHIFEAFYRGQYAKERQIHGNGLGLSLVKRIAEAHGGRVTVQSSPGAGARFTLHLPV